MLSLTLRYFEFHSNHCVFSHLRVPLFRILLTIALRVRITLVPDQIHKCQVGVGCERSFLPC